MEGGPARWGIREARTALEFRKLRSAFTLARAVRVSLQCSRTMSTAAPPAAWARLHAAVYTLANPLLNRFCRPLKLFLEQFRPRNAGFHDCTLNIRMLLVLLSNTIEYE